MKANLNKILKALKQNNIFLCPLSQYIKDEPVLVTINVTTYNHEKYIEKCLDGILNQFVNFRVQVNVHDDASTDGTVDILKRYKEKYPSIIHLILEDENQYSKDKTVIAKKYLEVFKGKYLAVCEGDDFWTDPYKLFLQYQLMEQNSQCSLCVHRVKVKNNLTGKISSYPNFKLKTQMFSNKKFMSIICKKYSFQTSSYFRRGTDYINYINNKPEFAKIMPNGDEAILLYSCIVGKIIYIDREMSQYNKFTETSWSLSNRNDDFEKERIRNHKIEESLKLFNKTTTKKYNKCIEKRLNLLKISLFIKQYGRETLFQNKEMRRIIFHYDILWYFKLMIKYFFCKN